MSMEGLLIRNGGEQVRVEPGEWQELLVDRHLKARKNGRGGRVFTLCMHPL